MLYFLNSPVLSNWGNFILKKISLDVAVYLWNSTPDSDKLSACGHSQTAEFLNKLGFIIEENRIQIKMNQGDRAIILKLNTRLNEGTLLTDLDLEKTNYEFGLLEYINE